MKAVNLLPSAQRGSAKTQPAAAITAAPNGGNSFGAWLLIGVLGVAVVCSAMYVLTKNTISERQAKLQNLTAEAAATRSQAAALQTFADFQTLATQRVTTVKGLAGSRFDWEKTLRDLSRALPSDVYIQQMQGSTGQQAAGTTGMATAIQAPAVHMTGCTRSQDSVARLMSRLRIVRGVTRVTLAKSDKDGSVVASGGLSGTGVTPAQPCPKGTPPAFDVTIYFERSPLAAGAAPNLGTTQAPAAGGATTSPGGSATTTPGAAPTPQAGGTATAPNNAAAAANTASTPTTQPVSNPGATTQGGAK